MADKISQGISKGNIDFLSATNILKDSVFSNMVCNNIGRILSFNKDNQTVEVELMTAKKFSTQTVVPTVLSEVPLIVYGTPSAQVTLPDMTGATCLIVTLDRNMDSFMETGEQYVPSTTRMHNITDSVAITTFFNFASPLKDYDENALSLQYEKVINNILYKAVLRDYANSIILNSTGFVTNNQRNVGNIDLNTGYVETKSSTVTIDEQGYETAISGIINVNPNSVLSETTAGGQIEVTGKINVQNTAQNLATLIQSFLTACEGIATKVDEQGGTLTDASKQAFTELKAKFQELLI